MVPVSLFDTLTFTHNDGQGLNFKVSGADFSEPPEENLVVRAVRIFELESRETVNLNVILEKHIPSGAGLGGGSGNAAGTIQALNHLYRKSSEAEGLLSPETILAIASELGSDVPFFLEPSPCEIKGRGEKIKPLLKFPKLFLIIIKPPLSISTKDAYKKCLPKKQTNLPNVCSIDDLKSYFQNQFETSLLVQYPVLSELKTLLLENGAFGALVSGSGSAVFGAYYDKILQNHALKKISCLPVGEIFSCETMVTHSYF
jgi:4-diphosphocytidyl-2-C-methyl-D-erythritol kinase